MKIKKENIRESKKIKQIKNNIIVLITVIAIFITGIITFSNKTMIKSIIKTEKDNILKELDQEGENYRLVTSADNVQVPVPKGYVASGVTGENYVTPKYQHTTNTYKVTNTVLTWSSPEGEQYPWTQDENGIWISGNQGIPSSTSTIESEEFEYIKGATLTINYTYSSQELDRLNIYIIDLINNKTINIVYEKYGNTYSSFNYRTSTYTYTMNDWGTGRYKIQAIYKKNASTDQGLDSAYIKLSTYYKEDENGNTVEVDQKNKIHDGGFVIYELTNSELETDPNGTSVIINDTNKDTAQSTRNQYVWVPVTNIEDLILKKIANNGIMQFGQGYSFSNTSITKETSTGTDYYREPRLIENNNKTKRNLQRYSSIHKREDFLNNMQEDFTRVLKSINKYKGFYIGRYETGDDHSHASMHQSFIAPKIVRYNGNTDYVSWDNSYKAAKQLAGNKEKYVKTGMIYDTMWDYVLKWLNETDTRSYKDIYLDSGTWGNYYNNTKTVTSGGTFIARTGAIETITYNGETFVDFPTASNNIFDIAGNVYEWTIGRYNSSYRELRGGDSVYSSYSSKNMASGRSNYCNSSSNGTSGLRIILCIN